jgi:small subunit ribosomal protein S21
MRKDRDNKVTGATVVVWNDNVEKALRTFKKKVADLGTLKVLRDKEFFEKPTTKRKRKKGAAKARWRKQLRSQALPPKLY